MAELPKLSDEFRESRTSRLMNLARFNSFSATLGIGGIATFLHYVSTRLPLNLVRWAGPEAGWTDDCWSVACFYFPGLLIRLLHVVYTMSPVSPNQYKTKPKRREFHHLYLCLITKGDNIQTVRHSVREMQHFQDLDPRITLHILTDEGKEHRLLELCPGVTVDVVPTAFRPPVAKYKARCLEWFRLEKKLQDDDWVLHLDEETVVDEHSLRTYLDFIERGDAEIGQGVIFYNSRTLWTTPLLTVADLGRISDDFGRFQFLVNYFHQPIIGIHGSHILTSGRAENAAGWDTACVAEDYWFSVQAANRGLRFGWLPTVAREQSPESVADFMRQRRRWYTGIWGTGHLPGRVSLVWWSCGACEPIFWSMFLLSGSRVLPTWISLVILLDVSIRIFSGVSSCLIQDVDSGFTGIILLQHVLVTLALTPVAQIMEGYSIISALVWPTKGFYTIKKY